MSGGGSSVSEDRWADLRAVVAAMPPMFARDEFAALLAERDALASIVRRFVRPPFGEGFQEVDVEHGQWIRTRVWGDDWQSEHDATPIDPDELDALRAALSEGAP